MPGQIGGLARLVGGTEYMYIPTKLISAVLVCLLQMSVLTTKVTGMTNVILNTE